VIVGGDKPPSDTPIADAVARHLVPTELDRRLRSRVCLEGGDGCDDPVCLCTCHDARDLPADPSDETLRRVLAGLDLIIAQVPGSWDGFAAPAPPLCDDPVDVRTLSDPAPRYQCTGWGCDVCATSPDQDHPDEETQP
jgi:hypothetical protein